MRKPLYKKYEHETPIGITYIASTFGVLIYEPLSEDSNCDFVAAWTNGEAKFGFAKHKVYFGSKDEFYIRKGNLRIYLQDCLRYDEM